MAEHRGREASSEASVKRNAAPIRAVLTNWQGSPCPRCARALRYHSELPDSPPGYALVLLTCPIGHLWQERLNLETLHSGIFVERRRDLEKRRPGAADVDDAAHL
jgi:hypothetical protein